jgi:hypothetical protein
MSSETQQIQIENVITEITNIPNIDLIGPITIPKIPNDETVIGNLANNLTVKADLVMVNKLSQNVERIPDKMGDHVIENTVSLGGNEVIFTTVKDIIFNLILNNKSLRSKLNELLETPNKAIEDISKIFNEISDKLNAQDIDSLRKFVCVENTRSSIGSILINSFNDIMADGKIDLNDTNHFLTLIYNIINLFNNYTESVNLQITLSTDTIFFFLYFIIKCTLVLTLDGEDETTALGLLDTTFKLVKISILPLSGKKCSCNLFSCFTKK